MTPLQSDVITISIMRSSHDVYDFIYNPENLPKWASGLAAGIKNENGEWVAESPFGLVKIKFVKRNDFGVLDHQVTLPDGLAVINPMRVIANQEGCEVQFTLFRQTEMSDQKFKEDREWILKDLKTLKKLMEDR